jgi:hypothetical protein
MTDYFELLKQAPPHDTDAFLQYLREHNEVLLETRDWLVIRNVKYKWPTAFLKKEPNFRALMDRWPDCEWRKKPKSEQTVGRFHVHIITERI